MPFEAFRLLELTAYKGLIPEIDLTNVNWLCDVNHCQNSVYDLPYLKSKTKMMKRKFYLIGSGFVALMLASIMATISCNQGPPEGTRDAQALRGKKIFEKQCNSDSLNLLKVEEDNDIEQLKDLIESHYNYTMSPLAQRILENWEVCLPKFIKVFPEEYKQALIRLEKEKLETI